MAIFIEILGGYMIILGLSFMVGAGSLEYYAALTKSISIVQTFANELSPPIQYIYFSENGYFGEIAQTNDSISYLSAASSVFRGQLTRIATAIPAMILLTLGPVRIIENFDVNFFSIVLLILVEIVSIYAFIRAWRFGHVMLEEGYLKEEDHL